TNDRFTLSILASNVIRNVALHLGTTSSENRALEQQISVAYAWVGMDVNDAEDTWRNKRFATRFTIPSWNTRIEDLTGNPFHVVLIFVTLCPLLTAQIYRRDVRVIIPALALSSGFVLFCAVLKWQPWHTRLHLPLFVLWSPLTGLVLQRQVR